MYKNYILDVLDIVLFFMCDFKAQITKVILNKVIYYDFHS